MKIMHEQVSFYGNSAVNVKLQEKPHFTYPWHFHSEYELVYVVKGEGTRFIANSVENFGEDDLVFLGSKLPHFWRADESYYQNESRKKVKYIVIQFSNTFFRTEIETYPEFNAIKDLFERADRGVYFSPEFAKKVKKEMVGLVNFDGLERTLKTLKILNRLAKFRNYCLLAGELYHVENFRYNGDRLTKVMHYLNTNYRKKIELKQVAEIAHLQEASFCRFFKDKTGKTLTHFVNDMRISYACQLIIDGKLTISQICFESGFGNLSNFNKIFKNKTGYTPSAYANSFLK